jgi:hypothetical protein
MQRLTLKAVVEQLEQDGSFLTEEHEVCFIYQHPKGGPSGTVTVSLVSVVDDGEQLVRVRVGRHID